MKNRILAILAITVIATAAPLNVIRAQRIMTGAEQTERYTDKIRGKKIAILANQTSRIGNRHIVDSLYSLNVDITGIFAPEHGFRGDEGAGEVIKKQHRYKNRHKDSVNVRRQERRTYKQHSP